MAAIAPAAWYRRRTTKVIGATAVAGALVLGGAFAYSHAPEYAVAKAMDNVGTLPVGGTLTIDEKGSPEFTFGATQDAFSFGATYQDSTVELVTTEDVAAFRVQLGGEDRPSESDLAMLDSMAPGLDQVLSGRWVSVDVSGDSALAKELARTGAKTEPDPEVQAAVQDLITTARDSFSEHLTVQRGTSGAARPAGSRQYDLIVDAQGLFNDVRPELQDVLRQYVAASIDTPMASGLGLTPDAIDLMTGEVLDGIATELPDTLPTVHAWINGDRFTQILVDSDPAVTLTLTQEPVMITPVDPVPLDDAILKLLTQMDELAGTAGNPELTASSDLSPEVLADLRKDPQFAGMTDEEFYSLFGDGSRAVDA